VIGWVASKAAGAAMWIWGTVGDIVNTAIGAGVTVVNDFGGYLTFNPPTLHWAKAHTAAGDYTTLVSVGGLSNFVAGGLTRISHSPDAASSTMLMAALSNAERAACEKSGLMTAQTGSVAAPPILRRGDTAAPRPGLAPRSGRA